LDDLIGIAYYLDVEKMIHHVTMLGGSDRVAHSILEYTGQHYNFLIAADELEYKLKNISLPILHNLKFSSSHLILDSGVLGAAKKGKPQWMEKGTERVLYWGDRIQADRIACVDIPSEPHILKMLGISVDEARDITTENTKAMMKSLDDRKAIISVQGWTLDDRKRSLEQLLPMIEEYQNAWIGNGSTCMLTPRTGLYKFYEWLCSELPDRHIHAWGIANPKWLVNLYRIGISSADSGTAGFANGMNEEISPITGKRTKKGWLGKRNSFISALGFIKNMEAIEQSFDVISKKELFYSKNGQSNQMSIQL
jgi:hypothetical protein